jgi:hypothetical protein
MVDALDHAVPAVLCFDRVRDGFECRVKDQTGRVVLTLVGTLDFDAGARDLDAFHFTVAEVKT